MSMEMPPREVNRTERIAEVKRLLDMYHRDMADAAEGIGRLDAEDEKRTQEEIERLEKELKELEDLERGA